MSTLATCGHGDDAVPRRSTLKVVYRVARSAFSAAGMRYRTPYYRASPGRTPRMARTYTYASGRESRQSAVRSARSTHASPRWNAIVAPLYGTTVADPAHGPTHRNRQLIGTYLSRRSGSRRCCQLATAYSSQCDASLRNTNPRDAGLLGATLRDANPRGAGLLGATLRDANSRRCPSGHCTSRGASHPGSCNATPRLAGRCEENKSRPFAGRLFACRKC